MDFTEVDISKIEFSRRNPRGIDIQLQDTKLSYLKDSIKDFGVLVPIVVTPKNGGYLLVDGERRFYAAKAVGLKRLPAFIVKREGGGQLSARDVLFRMFQIHHLREPWGPVQECSALEATYDRITGRNDIKGIADVRAQIKAVTEELARETAIEERTAWDRVKFLRWPHDVKEKLYGDPSEKGYWYICEIEEKIVVPALTNYPEYFEKVDVNEVRRDLFKKLNVAVERSTEPRKVAPFFRVALLKAPDRKALCRVLDHLRSDVDMTYGEAEDELARNLPAVAKRDPPTPRRLLNLLINAEHELDSFDVSTMKQAKGRRAAKKSELAEAARSLQSALERLVEQLSGERA